MDEMKVKIERAALAGLAAGSMLPADRSTDISMDELEALVEQGMVERCSDPNDRRVVMIRPTATGKARFNEEMERRMDAIDRAVARIGEEDAEKLTELLGVFVETVYSEVEGEK